MRKKLGPSQSQFVALTASTACAHCKTGSKGATAARKARFAFHLVSPSGHPKAVLKRYTRETAPVKEDTLVFCCFGFGIGEASLGVLPISHDCAHLQTASRTDGRLAELAKRRGVPQSVLVRETIEAKIAEEAAAPGRRPANLIEALGDSVGSIARGKRDSPATRSISEATVDEVRHRRTPALVALLDRMTGRVMFGADVLGVRASVPPLDRTVAPRRR